MKGKTRRNKYKNRILLMKMLVSLVIVALLGFGGTTFAKYYSLELQKGVGVASEFYFESDYLNKVDYTQEGIVDFQSFSTYVASGQWSGTGQGLASVAFQVRNYKNRLLYNKDMDITYDVYAKMAETDATGISYKISYNNVDITLKREESNNLEDYKVFSDIVLEGAEETSEIKLFSNDFALTIEPNGETEEPADVYVWAVPKAPSYVDKDNYTLGVRLSMTKQQQQFTLNGIFDIASRLSEATFFTEEEKRLLNRQSGFIYNITTSGEYEKELVGNKIPVHITWNAKYLQIDKFSEYYNEEAITKNGDIRTMTMYIDTYSFDKIVFFRTSSFNLDDENMDSKDELLNFVSISAE